MSITKDENWDVIRAGEFLDMLNASTSEYVRQGEEQLEAFRANKREEQTKVQRIFAFQKKLQ